MSASGAGTHGLHELFSAFTGAVVITDSARVITYVNESTELLFGYDEGELMGQSTALLYADEAEFRRMGRERFNPELDRPFSHTLVRYRHKDGSRFRGNALGGPIRGPTGEVEGFVGIIRPATLVERAVDVLQRIHEITSSSSLELDLQVELVLGLGAEHFGLDQGLATRLEGDELVVTHCVDPTGRLSPGLRLPLPQSCCQLSLQERGPLGIYALERSQRRPEALHEALGAGAYLGCPVLVDGHIHGTLAFHGSQALLPFHEDDRGLVRLFSHWLGHAIAQDRYREQLTRLATYDDLTGLLNRRVALERLTWLRAQALRSDLPLTVLVFDLDHFKGINDRFGHAVGDRVLGAVARAATGAVRAVDEVARVGGEEFLVMLPDTPVQGALEVHRRLAEAFEAIEIAELPELPTITASFGAACLRGEESMDELLSRADAALYAAKSSGRARLKRAP